MTAELEGGAAAARTRYRRGEGGRLREDILDAASRLFFEQGGAEGMTMRAVAAAAGVSPPAVYLHFADKDELIFAVCQGLFTQLDEALESAAAGIDDPLEAMKARGRAYVRFGLDHPDHYRVLFMRPPGHQPHSYGPDEVKASAAFGNLIANVATMQADPRVRQDIDPYELAIDCWAYVHGVTSLLISLPDFGWPEPEVLLDGHFDRLLSGLMRR
ncbi:MAG TPA: TetR/AcrR family transcriptional regulator [Acidimicrobiia bacterium]|jgi:AcrR family transcriptional regulator|nr:TetR/AcrR family transcriptional regulator [Acidimicrobiia bacterium]